MSAVKTSALTLGTKVNSCREKNQLEARITLNPSLSALDYFSSEFHVTWFRPRLSSLRKDIGIKNTMSLESSMDGRDTYYAYINGLDKSFVMQYICSNISCILL